jgi:hypothetical protein
VIKWGLTLLCFSVPTIACGGSHGNNYTNFTLLTFNQIFDISNTGLSILETRDGATFTVPVGVTNPIWTFPATGGTGTTQYTAAVSVLFNNSKYWILYEINNSVGGVTVFGVASASQLAGPYTWVTDVTARGSGGFVWNPRWFIDDDGTIYVIYNTSSSFGASMQPFIITPTNPGTFTTWSAARAVTGTSLPGNMIDYQLIGPRASPNGKYNWWYKNDTSKQIEYMTSTSRESGYTVTVSGNWTGKWSAGVGEGPILRKMSGLWTVYLDRYIGSPNNGYQSSTNSAGDWSAGNWSTLTPLTPPPFQAGTGSALGNGEAMTGVPK